MKKIILLYILFCTCTIVLHAQNKKKSSKPAQTTSSVFSTTASGLQYKIIKDSVGGSYPEKGGYISFWFDLRTSKDSIFLSQFSKPNPIGIPTPEITYKPSIEEGFALLTEGDSAVFLLNADSLYQKTFRQARPAYLNPQSTITMIVKMSKVYSKSFVDSVISQQEKSARVGVEQEKETFKKDSASIQKYLKDNNLKGLATIDGAYVVKLKENKSTNAFIEPLDTVQTTYIGKLLIEGTEFDRSPIGEYFTFVVGVGQVIRGWDQGFQKLKHGEKALILIPSRLAYGSRGAGGSIPPNAPLIFEVEVK